MKDTTRLERVMEGEDPKTVLEAEWDSDDHRAASGMLRMAFDKMAGLIDMFSLNDAIKDKVKKLKKEFKKFRSKFRPILHGEELVDEAKIGEGALYVLNVEYQANGTYDVTYLIGDEQDNATTMKGLNRGKMEKLVADIMKNVI